jgi:hypothetical protein
VIGGTLIAGQLSAGQFSAGQSSAGHVIGGRPAAKSSGEGIGGSAGSPAASPD